jgi:hypothetical protein
MISTEIIPERLLLIDQGQIFLSKKKVTPQISKLLSCLCTEPCRKEDLVLRIWGYEYDPLRHDPMVLTLVQRLRDCLGDFRSRLLVDQGIYEIAPHYAWINPRVLQPSAPSAAIKFNEKELSYRQFQILAFIDRQGSASIGQVMKSFQVSRMTCHRELEILRKKSKISRSGKGRGSIYLSSMIFR